MTSYLVLQGLAPSLWGPVSDVKGRRIAYFCTFLVFLGACIGLAQARNYAAVVVLRCLQSTGSASTIAIGSGVIGDITTRAERGGLMGIFLTGLLMPVAVGPVIGGVLAGSLGWRAIFWFLAVYSGSILALLALLLPETLRSVVDNGSRVSSNIIVRFPLVLYQKTTKVKWDRTAKRASSSSSSHVPKKHVDVLGPFGILISRQATCILFFVAVYYAVWQMGITAMSSLFANRYGLGETKIGLTFMVNGVGCMVGTLVTGKILDSDYGRIKSRHDARQTESVEDGAEKSFPLEKARLRHVPLFALVQCLSVMLFGWTIQYPRHVPIAVPIVSTFITGWTACSIQSVITTYLVDVFHDRSAASTASMNLARCLLGAGGTSLIMPLVNAIGVGLAFTACVGMQVMALALLAMQWRWGGQ